MQISIQKLRNHGYDVHIEGDTIDIVQTQRSHGIAEELYNTLRTVLPDAQAGTLAEETSSKAQAQQIIQICVS